jgi:phosphate uptake regulator
VISLPKKWVKKVNLKAGDSLVVTEQAGALLFETSVIEKESHVKEIRISQMESSDELASIIIANYHKPEHRACKRCYRKGAGDRQALFPGSAPAKKRC